MRRLLRDQRGATMVEYAMMMAFVVAVAFVAVQLFGGAVRGLFDSANGVFP